MPSFLCSSNDAMSCNAIVKVFEKKPFLWIFLLFRSIVKEKAFVETCSVGGITHAFDEYINRLHRNLYGDHLRSETSDNSTINVERTLYSARLDEYIICDNGSRLSFY